MVMMGWLVGAKGDANGDRPCKPEPTAPGGDVAVEDGPLAKGGPNGRHRPPLPCGLPMEGFPYEFGPETER